MPNQPYTSPDHSDNPSCPNCGTYNALISPINAGPEGGFAPVGLKCRDCHGVFPHPVEPVAPNQFKLTIDIAGGEAEISDLIDAVVEKLAEMTEGAEAMGACYGQVKVGDCEAYFAAEARVAPESSPAGSSS